MVDAQRVKALAHLDKEPKRCSVVTAIEVGLLLLVLAVMAQEVEDVQIVEVMGMLKPLARSAGEKEQLW